MKPAQESNSLSLATVTHSLHLFIFSFTLLTPHSLPGIMSQSQNIAPRADASLGVAPTPQNTPLDTAVLSNRPATIGKTTMEEIGEGEGDDDEDAEDAVPMNPASLLASVSLCCAPHCCCKISYRDRASAPSAKFPL